MEVGLDRHGTDAPLARSGEPSATWAPGPLGSNPADPGAEITHRREPSATRLVLLATAALLLATAPAASHAEDPGDASTPWSSAALFAGGAASGFLLHEGCHGIANLALGNTPSIERVTFAGFIPFFAVSPDITCVGDRCFERDGTPFGSGKRGLYTIVTAGIQCQQLADEIILTHDPALRTRQAPFRKGMLAFGTLTSIAYVLSNWASVEPPAGDLRGAYRDTGAPRNVVNLLVLSAAVLDLSRYFFPDAPLLPWLSRAAKIGVTGIAFTL